VARLVPVLTLVGAALLLTARAATANARGEYLFPSYRT